MKILSRCAAGLILLKLTLNFKNVPFDLAHWFDGIKKLNHPWGLSLFLFALSAKRNKKKNPLRSLRLCGENRELTI
jgi:hypothetical protein